MINEFKPNAVIVDPITNLVNVANELDVKVMLTRLIDHLKSRQITAMFTNLTHVENLERTEAEVSSIMDTWILLKILN